MGKKETVMSYRIVKKIVTGRQAIDGAGVHLVRVLGSGTIRDFDPFLMLDAFDSLESCGLRARLSAAPASRD